MTFLISVHGESCKLLIDKLNALAKEKTEKLGVPSLYSKLVIASLADVRKLGFFDPGQSLIALSEALAVNASWEDTSSVFLHELAHALDWHLHGTTGHTPLFRHCCEMLGVDPGFSKSKVFLKMDEADGKREKIKKLLALSSSPFENEAAEAVKKAQSLMLEYGTGGKAIEKVYSATLHEGHNSPGWTKTLAAYLSETAGVYALFTREQGKVRLNVYGSLEEVEFAVYVTTYILEASERELRRLRGMGERTGRQAFLLAAIQALRKRTGVGHGNSALALATAQNQDKTLRLVLGPDAKVTMRRTKSFTSDYESYDRGASFGRKLEVSKDGVKLLKYEGKR